MDSVSERCWVVRICSRHPGVGRVNRPRESPVAVHQPCMKDGYANLPFAFTTEVEAKDWLADATLARQRWARRVED